MSYGNRRPLYALLLPLLLLLCLPLRSQERSYFYSGREFGSDALINPGTLLVNGGLDILQSGTHSRRLSIISFQNGWRNVSRNLADPFTQIRKFGTDRFIGQEVFPTSVKLENAQWMPNYTLHLIGGGYDARLMFEWYRYHGFPLPALWAGATVTGYQLLNEVVENGRFAGPNVDPIADVYIFNLGGLLLFSSDDVAEFFSSTLHMTSWGGQPAWNPRFGTLENHGQNYVIRYPLPFLRNTSLFYHFGDNGLFGLSFLQPDDESITFAVGATQRQLRTVDVRNGARTVTVELGWMAGIYYDRANSLLASMMLSDRINERVRFNIYPGVIDLWGFRPGLFFVADIKQQFVCGLSVQYSPLGLAYRNKL